MQSTLTADQALMACRELSLRYECDLRQPDGLWRALCPLCVLYTDGRLELEVRESARGGLATLSCRRGCDSTEIADHLTAALSPQATAASSDVSSSPRASRTFALSARTGCGRVASLSGPRHCSSAAKNSGSQR